MHNSPGSLMLKYSLLTLTAAIIMFFGKTLFIPLFFGLLIAMIMHPISKWLERRGWNKSLAIGVCILIVTLLISLLVALLIWQLNVFRGDTPLIVRMIKETSGHLNAWLLDNLGITAATLNNWTDKLTGMFGSKLSSTIQMIINSFFVALLIPIFTALIMSRRKVLVEFLRSILPERHRQNLDKILLITIHTYFNYIKGMIMVYVIVGILNSIGLLALGVKHAILYGMLCAIMTIIPYIGITISALLPISVIWMQTGNFWYPLGVIAIFSFVQYLEANVIFPKVVGSQLEVSTLAMLVSIILGGIIWGVAGMVLFIPFVAIAKIISDHIEEWKPINLLISRK
ncbi:MAG: AI-2E family transporter [Bacteroidota bacterium]|nr:AI-2E family transporter [Bacteroidota bacterium]MDP4250901.1 AI-2E family transporter [Bacteroidota bacterium]